MEEGVARRAQRAEACGETPQGNQGAALLKREYGIAVPPRIRWNEKNRSVGRVYLEHALLVSEVMVAIELACRQNSHIRLITDEELPLRGRRTRWRVNIQGGTKLGIMRGAQFRERKSEDVQNPTALIECSLRRSSFFSTHPKFGTDSFLSPEKHILHSSVHQFLRESVNASDNNLLQVFRRSPSQYNVSDT
jgi:hypothetical protein